MPEIKCLKCLEEVLLWFCSDEENIILQDKFTCKPFKPHFPQMLLVYPWSHISEGLLGLNGQFWSKKVPSPSLPTCPLS